VHLVGFTIEIPCIWYDAVCTVLDSWWWAERPSETCRVLFQNKINLRYCASSWFYYRNPMYGMMLFVQSYDSWWWAERPSETCRVLFQNKINLRYCASGWFYYRNVQKCDTLQHTTQFFPLIMYSFNYF